MQITACGSRRTHEKPPPRNFPPIGGLVFFAVQSSKHRCGHQSSWPNHATGPYQPLPRQSGKRIAQNLSRQRQEDLVNDTKVLMVEVRLLDDHLWGGASVKSPLAPFRVLTVQTQGPYVGCKGKAKGDIATDIYACVLFPIPPSLGQPPPQPSKHSRRFGLIIFKIIGKALVPELS